MIPFEKHHGCGNTFIIVEESDIAHTTYDQLAIQMCHPYTGIGADGFMVVKREPLTMLFYNQDGSVAPMCGNGIRCFANYMYHHGLHQSQFDIETGAGTMKVDVKQEQPFRVEIDMGKPNWDMNALCLSKPIPDAKSYQLDVLDRTYEIHSVFLGTIHSVVIVDEINIEEVEVYGKAICEHTLFAQKTNVNFVCIEDKANIHVMTYERGVGITQACGTGCCASIVFTHLLQRSNDIVKVRLALGSLIIKVADSVYMDGPAKQVAIGQYEEDSIC